MVYLIRFQCHNSLLVFSIVGASPFGHWCVFVLVDVTPICGIFVVSFPPLCVLLRVLVSIIFVD